MNINDNELSSESQNAKIAAYLMAGNSITQLDALNMFGCFRLASRINDIKKRYDMDIVTDRVITHTGKRVASYRMKGGAE